MQAPDLEHDRPLHGITYDPKRRSWKARIHFAGRETYIGRYNSAHEAALAYDQAARMINGVQDTTPAQPKPRRRPLNFPDTQQHDPELEAKLLELLAVGTAAAGSPQRTPSSTHSAGPAGAQAEVEALDTSTAAAAAANSPTGSTQQAASAPSGVWHRSASATTAGHLALAEAAATHHGSDVHPHSSHSWAVGSMGLLAGRKRGVEVDPSTHSGFYWHAQEEVQANKRLHSVHGHGIVARRSYSAPADSEPEALAAPSAQHHHQDPAMATNTSSYGQAVAGTIAAHVTLPHNVAWDASGAAVARDIPAAQPHGQGGLWREGQLKRVSHGSAPSLHMLADNTFTGDEPSAAWLPASAALAFPPGTSGVPVSTPPSFAACPGPELPTGQLGHSHEAQQWSHRQVTQHAAQLHQQLIEQQLQPPQVYLPHQPVQLPHHQHPQQQWHHWPQHPHAVAPGHECHPHPHTHTHTHRHPGAHQASQGSQMQCRQHEVPLTQPMLVPGYHCLLPHQQHLHHQHYQPQHHQQQQQQEKVLAYATKQEAQDANTPAGLWQGHQHRRGGDEQTLWDQGLFLNSEDLAELVDLVGLSQKHTRSTEDCTPRRSVDVPVAAAAAATTAATAVTTAGPAVTASQVDLPISHAPKSLQPPPLPPAYLGLGTASLFASSTTPPPQRQQQGQQHPVQALMPPAWPTHDRSAPSAVKSPGGLFGSTCSKSHLLSVINCFHHHLLDLHLAVLVTPSPLSSLVRVQAYIQQMHDLQLEPAPPQGPPVHGMPSADAVALNLMDQLLLLLTDTSNSTVTGQERSPEAENEHVLRALQQLQQALTGLQQIAAAADDSTFSLRSCLATWQTSVLDPSLHTAHHQVVRRLTELL